MRCRWPLVRMISVMLLSLLCHFYWVSVYSNSLIKRQRRNLGIFYSHHYLEVFFDETHWAWWNCCFCWKLISIQIDLGYNPWWKLGKHALLSWSHKSPLWRKSIDISQGCYCCWVTSVVSDSVRPHRRQPTRLPHPWDSPSKNTEVGFGCHFLLQCMKVKSESEVVQLCPTLSDPMDCSLPGSSVHGIFQASVLEWGAIAFSDR